MLAWVVPIVLSPHYCSFSLSHMYIHEFILFYFKQELLTRHKATVAEFLSKNYDWVSTSASSLNYAIYKHGCVLIVHMP
jgi:hypothetical protein